MMTNTLKRICGICTLISAVATHAQTQSQVYQPGITQEGIVYYLPKTGLRIEVEVEKTTYTPGDFCQYAERYLRVKGVSPEPSEQYRIVKIHQTAYPVADTTKCYAVKFDIRSVACQMTLSDEGILQAINDPQPQHAAPSDGHESVRIETQQSSIDPRQYLSEEILSAGSKAKMAELTALDIYEVRESRNLLTRGQADYMPKDGDQLRQMLARLDAQDKAMSSLFTGTTLRDTLHHVITLVPDSAVNGQVLFRFSQQLGMVETDDLAGSPYYINIENLTTLPQMEATKKNSKPLPGLYVNVPGRLRATITNMRQQTVLTADYPAGQFGQTELLSGALFNKRYTTRLWLHPLSGAVERLEAEQPK